MMSLYVDDGASGQKTSYVVMDVKTVHCAHRVLRCVT